MFVELVEEISTLSKPSMDLPKFVDKKPLDLITAIISMYGLSKDTDRYANILISNDKSRIYVTYKDLYKDLDTAYANNVIMYQGNVCMLTLVDYNQFSSEDADPHTAIMFIYIMCMDAITFLKAKNVHMMYRSTNTLLTIFNEAVLPLFIQSVLLSYSMSDKLKEIMIEVVQELKKDEKFEMKDLDFYIDVLDTHGISLLLDSSVIAVNSCKPNNDEKNEEDETV